MAALNDIRDLLDIIEGSEGQTVHYRGHAYIVKEVRYFRYVTGVDAVVLDPKDKTTKWYRDTKAQMGDDWMTWATDPEDIVAIAEQLVANPT